MLGLTHSSWINAWTLRQACAPLGVDLRVVAGPRQLPLPAAAPGDAAEWLFFTEEASLRRALAGGTRGARFLPTTFPDALLDDKFAFAEFLAADPDGPRGLAQCTLAELDHGAAVPSYPMLLKARHSWLGDRKLPRGWVCRDAVELASRRRALAAAQLDEAWFFLQEWLGDASMRLLSVCGFFDAEAEARGLALVTERVADYGGDGPTSSAMLVTAADAHDLVAAAARVLRRLRYRGPYELEFIVAGGQVRALELNPRFWMQHGLFLADGNGLVRRYLGMDSEAEPPAAPPKLLWVDGTWLLRRLLRADRRVLELWRTWVCQRGHRPVVCPSLGAALWAGLWRLAGGGR